jgi:predicted methyltransferase
VGHLSVKKMQQLQEIIIKAGLVIESIFPAFNEYEGGNIIGNISNMFILRGAKEMTAPIAYSERVTTNFYTAGTG